MAQIIECVPNFSEGRNKDVINAITDDIRSVPGVTLMDVDPGEGTNRTVVTFIGDEKGVKEAAFKAIKKASELIDMSKHKGAHPRMGATDVCPFIPVSEVTMEDCVRIANEVGERVGKELDIPVYLYEAAATRPERANLADIRAGEYEALPQKMKDKAWRPDFGPMKFNPRSGATVIGAREFLVAYNLNLNTKDKAFATDIAFDLRERGRSKRQAGTSLIALNEEIVRYAKDNYPCGVCEFAGHAYKELESHYKDQHNTDLTELLAEFKQDPSDLTGKPVKVPGLFEKCKSIGWYIPAYGRAQISCNLTDYKVTPAHLVLEKARELAMKRGIIITGSEIVGLVPYRALVDAGRYYIRKQGKSTGIPRRDILEMAIMSMGLREVAPFETGRKVIGLPDAPGPLVSMTVADFVDEVSRDTPAPGGGSVAALSGAIGAALSSMVANLTYTKKGYEAVKDELEANAVRAQEIKDQLVANVDSDTKAFDGLMSCFGLPKDTPEQKEARNKAIQEASKKAALVPLETARLCLEAIGVCKVSAEKGNKNSITDAGTGALVSFAGLRAAVYNVRTNLGSIKDQAFKEDLAKQCDELVAKGRELADSVDKLVLAAVEP